MKKLFEVHHTNNFLMKEIPESIGLKFIPIKISKCFNIYTKDGIRISGKKK